MTCCSPCAFLLAICLAGPATATEPSKITYSRRNPIVEAVQKTKEAIVTIKAARPGSAKDTVGTGVVIDERGFIVTNRHVIGRSKNVRVRLHDGTLWPAEFVWGESDGDLAVLRIWAHHPLQALELAPVADLMVGETVIAIGHPFGYTDTVSTGIVSALDREITMPTGATLTGLIQTSAGINPGNSGGPLLNINGELIGINVALRDGAQGIAFAINAGAVKQALTTHLSSARIAGVSHGLHMREKVLAETGQRQRVVVAANDAGNGLAQGDEIRAVGDHQVANEFDVERALWDTHPGDQVRLQVVRRGKVLSVNLVLSGVVGAARLASVAPPTERREARATDANVLIADPQR